MKTTYYEKKFRTGVLNKNKGYTGIPSTRGAEKNSPLGNIFIPVSLSKHEPSTS